MITIVLAEDHRIVRQGIKALLAAEPDLRVVGETGDGLEAVELIERLRPNVAVLDLMMPSLGGLDVARTVKARAPQTRVLVLSMHANEAYVLEALRAGALGYVVKESSADVLVYAIREVVAGHHYLGPPLSERSLVTYLEKAKAGAQTTYETLTPREREVTRLIAEGYSSPEIAERLVLSPRTVETHRANIMRKLDLRSTADLIRYAIRYGILPQE